MASFWDRENSIVIPTLQIRRLRLGTVHIQYSTSTSRLCASAYLRGNAGRDRGEKSLMVAGERSAFSLPWLLSTFASASHVQAPCLRVPWDLSLWPVITHLPAQNPNSHDNQTSTQGRPARRAASSDPENQGIPGLSSCDTCVTSSTGKWSPWYQKCKLVWVLKFELYLGYCFIFCLLVFTL